MVLIGIREGDDLTVAKFYPTNANIDPEDGGEFGRIGCDITDDGTLYKVNSW